MNDEVLPEGGDDARWGGCVFQRCRSGSMYAPLELVVDLSLRPFHQPTRVAARLWLLCTLQSAWPAWPCLLRSAPAGLGHGANLC